MTKWQSCRRGEVVPPVGVGRAKLWAPLWVAMVHLLLVGAAPVMAEGSLWQEFALDCSTKQDSLERLTCYDNVAMKMKSALAKKGQPGAKGNWVLEEERDPITDKNRVVLFMRDREFNPFNRPYILNIRCENKKLEVYIHWERHLGDGGEIEVITRLDKKPAESGMWRVSRDKNAAFFMGNPEQLTRSLAEAKILLARVTPHQAREVTAEFELEGLGGMLAPVLAACPFVTPAK